MLFKKIIFSILLLIISSVCLSYFYRTSILNYVANATLEKYQITVSNISEVNISNNAVELDHVTLLLEESGLLLNLDLITIEYDYHQIMSNSIDALIISKLTVEFFEPVESFSPSTPLNAGANEILIMDLLANLNNLPVNILDIKYIEIPIIEEVNQLSFSLSSKNGNIRILFSDENMTFETLLVEANKSVNTKYDLQLGLKVNAEELLSLKVNVVAEQEQETVKLNFITNIDSEKLEQIFTLYPFLTFVSDSKELYTGQVDVEANWIVNNDLNQAPTEPFRLVVKEASQFTYLEKIQMAVKDDLELKLIIDEENPSVEISQGSLQVEADYSNENNSTIMSGAVRISSGRINLRDQTRGKLIFKAENIELFFNEYSLPVMDVNTAISLENDIVNFELALFSEGLSILDFSGQHDLDSNQGNGTLISQNLIFSPEQQGINKYFSLIPIDYEFDLVAGLFNTSANLFWQESQKSSSIDVSGNWQLTLDNVDGYFDTSLFQGLHVNIKGELLPSLAIRTLEAASISATSVDVGLEMKNINALALFDSSENSLVLENFSGQILGGEIGFDRVEYSPENDSNSVNLQFSHIDLSEVVKLAEYEGITVSGMVSGQLPVSISAFGVVVEDGRLSAVKPGGIIRYGSGAESSSSVGVNLSLDLVSQALSNYHYDRMTSDIQYNENGELVFNMQLEGSNPDMDNGQKINLNLNLVDDFEALLESLQASRGIEEFLERSL